MEAVLANAVARCPFLHNVAQREGQEFAQSIAVNPFAPVGKRPLLEEDAQLASYQTSFKLFHSEGGVVPLSLGASSQGQGACPARGAGHAATLKVPATPTACSEKPRPATPAGPLLPAHAPFATMSLSFGSGMPDFGRIFKALQQHNQHMRKPSQQQHKPRAQRQPGPSEQLRKPTNINPPSSGSTSLNSHAAGGGGQCPLRKMLGPLAPLVFNPKGHLACPEPIIRARAALAATKPVKDLRPQALHVKLAAVGAIAAACNVPCGVWREHTDKFSFQWFLAVHASIPFIAMLRKAVILPKYAILFTIAAAIAGQAVGAKMERKRLGRPSKGSSSRAVQPVAAVAPAAPLIDLETSNSKLRVVKGAPPGPALSGGDSNTQISMRSGMDGPDSIMPSVFPAFPLLYPMRA